MILFYRRYRALIVSGLDFVAAGQADRRTRIFTVRTFSVVSSVMLGLNIMWTIAFFAANLLQCLPISLNWSSWGAAPGAPGGTCIRTTMMYLAQAWSDVFTDVAILAMPLPWVCEPPFAPSKRLIYIRYGNSRCLRCEKSSWSFYSNWEHCESPLTIVRVMLTVISVVCAGVAKLVVFNKIIYGNASPILARRFPGSTLAVR